MAQQIDKSAVQPQGQVFTSLCAGFDGTIWLTNLAGGLVTAQFTVDPATGERKIKWQGVSSDRAWKQVVVGQTSDDDPGEELWCLDTVGNVCRVGVLTIRFASVSATRQVGDRTLALLSAAADGTTWGLDAAGKAFIYDTGRNVWLPQSQPIPFTRISVGDAKHVMALDSNGNAYALGENGSWQNTGSGLLDISVPRDGYPFAIGQKGNLLIQLDDGWFDCGGEGLKMVRAGSLSNVVVVDSNGNLADLTEGRPLTLGTGRTQTSRFDTEDPFNENKSTHLWIVNRGAILANDASGVKFKQLFQPDTSQTSPGGSVFHQAVCQGVYDADFVDSFNGPAIGPKSTPSYEAHFYDPDTGLNWRKHANPTALTRGSALFNSAVAAYRAGRIDLAGYALGVSLHYLTDLGQPMHAVNFTNVSNPPFYHSMFERVVMEIQNQCPMPAGDTINGDLLTTVPDDFFKNLARKSKKIWRDGLSELVPDYYTAVAANPFLVPDRHALVLDRTRPILQPMLTNAMLAVRAYVTEWMTIAEDPNLQAHPPICAGHQSAYWPSVLWVANSEGALQYYYTDQNPLRQTLQTNLESWFSGPKNTDAPQAPTQLAACMTAENTKGRGMVFALTDDGLYYTMQLTQNLGQPDKDVSGWTSWTQMQGAPKFETICACPYMFDAGTKLTTGASIWGVADGQLQYAMQQSKTIGEEFDPFKETVWSDWQVKPNTPKDITCLTASGCAGGMGYIFGLVDGVLYSSEQTNRGGWNNWVPLNIPGAPARLRLICACEAKQGSGYRVQLWGVDDQGTLHSTTRNSTEGNWPSWSGEWNANAPKNIVAMTAATSVPGSEFMRLWAFADGKLYAIWEQADAKTGQKGWSDWVAVPHYDGPPLPAKVSLPIGPLKLTIEGHDLPFLEILITEDPNQPALDPTSALRKVRVSFSETPDGDSIPGKMNLLRGTLLAIDTSAGRAITYEGSFDDNSHGSGTVTDQNLTNRWTASELPMKPPQPTILSVTPTDQVAAGFGQMLLIRGVDLPDTVLISQDGSDHLPQWTSYTAPEEALVRLPMNLHPGPATIRLTNADKTVSTPEFPITISTIPGTPVITAVSTYPTAAPVTKVAPGQKIAITAQGMDTSGAVIEWIHPTLAALTSASEFSENSDHLNYSVVTTVPNVTPNDNWTLSLRVKVNNVLSAAATFPIQT